MANTNDPYRQEQLDRWSMEREARIASREAGREVDWNGFAERHQSDALAEAAEFLEDTEDKL